MRIEEIWRFPVKSVGGERLEHADVDRLGIAGDRAWGIHDPATGLMLTARREPELLMAAARLVDGRPLITHHDGRDLSSDDALSAWLGRPVELRAAATGDVATFENPLDTEHETDWMEWQSANGTFHDSSESKISFVSTTTLGDDDPRRFRLNVILDGGGEDELDGELSLGSARITVRRPISRCVMVTRAQPGLPADRSVLRRIVAERDNRLGVGAVVTAPGSFAVGDELRRGG